MESKIEGEKQRIKNEIENFLKEQKIEFNQDERHITIKGELSYIVILKFVEISIKTRQDKHLTITIGKREIVLRYEETFREGNTKMIKIKKSVISAVYFTDNTLVILF